MWKQCCHGNLFYWIDVMNSVRLRCTQRPLKFKLDYNLSREHTGHIINVSLVFIRESSAVIAAMISKNWPPSRYPNLEGALSAAQDQGDFCSAASTVSVRQRGRDETKNAIHKTWARSCACCEDSGDTQQLVWGALVSDCQLRVRAPWFRTKVAWPKTATTFTWFKSQIIERLESP